MDQSDDDHIPAPDAPGLFGGDTGGDSYTVLARKYRPQKFEDLIGQEAMVRTLRNAFQQGRIHHAFMLTGVRGVGKTTTARIIARALNYEGKDGRAGPTVDLSEEGVHCAAIAASRHPDVQEMDAASRTGIGDIRDLIEGVRYAPVSARTKVYIIDEVHMLSTAAFNGLLKTLEEPPPHVVFIFATTEIRKVPVTVLSRCQRFDLKRVEPPVLIGHLARIAKAEGAQISEAALALIARAAEGSVRDSLSLLDQAIAQADGPIEAEAVRDMLGLADRTRTLDLFETLMSGEVVKALDLMGAQTANGAEPLAILQDLASLTHIVTKARLTGGVPDTEPEAERLMALSGELSMPVLARAWQMLLKGISEVQGAPDPIAAGEMVLIRLAHVSDVPAPDQIIRQLTGGAGAGTPATGPAPARPQGGGARGGGPAQATAPVYAPQAEAAPEPALPAPASFEAVIALAEQKGELRLAKELKEDVHLVRFEAGRIEVSPGEHAPVDLTGRLGKLLKDWTGRRWVVSVTEAKGAAKPTVRAQRIDAEKRIKAEAAEQPLVKAILETFPGAVVAEVRAAAEDEPLPAALPPDSPDDGPDGD